MKIRLRKAGICSALAIALAAFCPPSSNAQGNVPRYEVDPSWPKPLPDRWVTGEMGGVCVDSQDHVFIAQRVNDVGGMDGHLEGLTNDELNAGQAAPPVIEFDAEGKVVNSWGDAISSLRICTVCDRPRGPCVARRIRGRHRAGIFA